MKQVQRIGVSLETELLSQFDKLIDQQGYHNRSEAKRDLIRNTFRVHFMFVGGKMPSKRAK